MRLTNLPSPRYRRYNWYGNKANAFEPVVKTCYWDFYISHVHLRRRIMCSKYLSHLRCIRDAPTST